MNVEVGKTYLVDHSRKGRFVMRVIERDDEFVTGIVVSGKAKAMLAYNERGVGEEVTVRESFGKWWHQPVTTTPGTGALSEPADGVGRSIEGGTGAAENASPNPEKPHAAT